MSKLHRFARKPLVLVGGVISKGGDNDGGLLEVFGLNAVKDVFVGVMSAARIIQRILNKLKARQTDAIKGNMIRASGIGNGQCLGAQVPERFEPAPEKWAHCFVALHVNAANLA